MIKNETLAKKFIYQGFFGYFFTFLSIPLWYAIRIIFSNDMSVSDVGIFYSFISFFTILSIYNNLWLTWALNYFLPKYLIKNDYKNIKMIIIFNIIVQIITWILILLLLFLSSNWLLENYFHSPQYKNIFYLFFIFFITINILQIINSILKSLQDIIRSRGIQIIQLFFALIFIIFLHFSEIKDFTYYVFYWIFAMSIWCIAWVLFIFKYKYLFKSKTHFEKKVITKYTKYALWIFLWWQAWIIMWQIDQQMILYYLWTEQAWYYTNYLSIINIYILLLSPILWILFPIISELVHKKENYKVKLLLEKLYKYIPIVSLWIWVLFFVLWPYIIVTLFWNKFIFSWYLLQFSALFLSFQALIQVNLPILASWWEVKKNTITVFLAMLLNVIINIILIPVYWSIWAIIWTISAWVFMFLITIYRIFLKEKFNFNFFFLIKNIIIISILWIIIYITKDYLVSINDTDRYSNLLFLSIYFIISILILIIINIKEIKLLFKEIYYLKK